MPQKGDDIGISITTSIRQFQNEKNQCLNGTKQDRSIKGSIDEPICSLVNLINSCEDYYTTSSCSGRIIIVNNHDGQLSSKNSVEMKYVSHSIIEKPDDIIQYLTGKLSSSTISSLSSSLKFESFILHVRCRTLESARHLLHCAVASGQRNSGLMISNTGHLTVAIRNTLNLEVPLIYDGCLIVTDQYIEKLVMIANQKMLQNFEMIAKVEDNYLKQQKQQEEEEKG